MKVNKFRLWDNEQNKFIYKELNGWQQYTGKNDKNGEEIYEGDLLKTRTGEIGKVVWADGHFEFCILLDLKETDWVFPLTVIDEHVEILRFGGVK